MSLIVAIDGPAGTGKSTVTKSVAKKMNLLHVDTGAIYRMVALASQQAGVSSDAPAALGQLARSADIQIKIDSAGQNSFWVNGEDVSHDIRIEKISQLSSIVSQYQPVRDALLNLQRKQATDSPSGAILEGRDIGTVVFPGAPLKFFLTASAEVRAERRMKDLESKGQSVNLDEVLADIRERDDRDSKRSVAPLKCAMDAIEIDTSNLSQEQVTDTICEYVRKVQASRSKQDA